jgi:hypothetical protein
VSNLSSYYLQEESIFRLQDSKIMLRLKLVLIKKNLFRRQEELLESREKV